MKPAEAQALFAEMRSAFPNANVDADTVRIYQRELVQMNYDLAKEAVVSAIGTCRFLPTIAELHHHYGIARERRRRFNEQEQRRTERLAEDTMPHPPLRDIPAAAEYLLKLHGAADVVHLVQVSDGKCDDCPHVGARYAYFKLALCPKHVAARMRAAQQLEETG